MNDEGRIAGGTSAGGAGPSLIQRVIMAFTAPAKLGEVLRSYSPWFWTLLIPTLLAVVAFALLPVDLWRQTLEEAARAQPEGPDLDTLVTISRITGPLAAFVMAFIVAAAGAGILYLVFNVAFGLDATYKQHLSGMAHISWITTLGFLLLVPIWISKGNMEIALGLGLLLQEAPASFGAHYLNSITIFGLWGAAALGLIESGISGGRISTGKAVGTILVLYLVAAAVKAVMAMLGG